MKIACYITGLWICGKKEERKNYIVDTKEYSLENKGLKGYTAKHQRRHT